MSGSRTNDLGIRLEWKKLKQRDIFVCLSGAVCGDGSAEAEVHLKIQVGENSWRKVDEEGVINQSIDQSINQSNNHSINQPTYQSVKNVY